MARPSRRIGSTHRREPVIDRYAYLLLMGLCLLVTLPLEFVFGARVYRRWTTLLLVLIPEVILFTVWDVIGISRHHWSYNPAFVTGIRLPFSVPLEELVFFVVVPICGLLTYEAVGLVLGRLRRHRDAGTPAPQASNGPGAHA